MSTEYVVVPTAECENYAVWRKLGWTQPEASCVRVYPGQRPCPGCLGDGRRALLDQAVPVFDALDPANDGIEGEPFRVWVEMEP